MSIKYKMLKWTLPSMGVYVNLVLHLFMNKVLPVTYSYWKSAFWFHHSVFPRTCSSGQPSSCRMCLTTSLGFDLVVRVPSWLDSVFWVFEVERFLGTGRKGEWYFLYINFISYKFTKFTYSKFGRDFKVFYI